LRVAAMICLLTMESDRAVPLSSPKSLRHKVAHGLFGSGESQVMVDKRSTRVRIAFVGGTSAMYRSEHAAQRVPAWPGTGSREGRAEHYDEAGWKALDPRVS
jgi:hypothetical protein